MITIRTRPHGISINLIKSLLARVMQKTRGPKAVLQSLERGLSIHREPYVINPHFDSPTVHVLTGISTLKQAIKQKKSDTLLAVGPTLVVHPDEADNILSNPAIDIIFVPSLWVKQYYCSITPSLEPRIHIWKAGVAISPQYSSRKNKKYILYIKNEHPETQRKITSYWENEGYTVIPFVYTQFSHKEYLEALCEADFMVYISNSESQGLALQEAWMRDVPTLVWTSGTWSTGNRTWQDPSISAPYLEARTGMFIAGDTVDEALATFSTKMAHFTPRIAAIERFSDEVCIKEYLDILKKTGHAKT